MESFRSFVSRFLHNLHPESPVQGDLPLSSPDEDNPLISQLKKMQQMAEYEQIDLEQLAVEVLAAGMDQRRRLKRSMHHWHRLTPKEREVTAYICLGLSNEEIGQALEIATGTVKAHVHHILRKFEVQNRSQLQQLLVWWDAGAWLEG